MEYPKLQLNFKGDRAKIHRQLKVWCAKNEKQMTPTVMELIKKHLEENK